VGAEVPDGEVAISHEHSGWRWVTPEEYIARNLSPEVEAANSQFAGLVRCLRRHV